MSTNSVSTEYALISGQWILIIVDLSRSALFQAVKASLERLETDYIDVFWIHRFDPYTPIEETMQALDDLIRSGKVRYIGASSMWTYQFAMMQFCAEKNGWTKFVAMQVRSSLISQSWHNFEADTPGYPQNHYSLLYREEEREMNKFCQATGVAIVPVCFEAQNRVQFVKLMN